MTHEVTYPSGRTLRTTMFEVAYLDNGYIVVDNLTYVPLAVAHDWCDQAKKYLCDKERLKNSLQNIADRIDETLNPMEF